LHARNFEYYQRERLYFYLNNKFLNRPIEGSIPYRFIDASYIKVRTNGRYINKALLVVTGIREDGYCEILDGIPSGRIIKKRELIKAVIAIVFDDTTNLLVRMP
jgi:hypothetical protein